MVNVKAPAVIRFADFLGEKVPRFLYKHPSLTAAGIGVGIGTANMRGPEHVLEGSLMAEQLGVPGSKYGCEELIQFSDRKDYVSTKLAFEKKSDWDWQKGIGEGVGREAGRAGISGIRQAIGALSDVIKERFYAAPLRQSIFTDIVRNDPIVSRFEKEQPGSATQAYDTMQRVAPELSTDKSIVTAFLRNAAMSGGPLDYNLIKGVADAEASVHKARSEAEWYPGGKL
jgi:hypothetical protein